MIVRLVLVFPIIAVVLFCRLPDIVTITENRFAPGESDAPEMNMEKRYFPLVPGDTVFLEGSYTCSVITNGVLVSQASGQSFFTSVTHNDTSIAHDGKMIPVWPKTFHTLIEIEGERKEVQYTHFFNVTDSGTFQIAYRGDKSETKVDRKFQMVIPRLIEAGYFDTLSVTGRNKWNSFPLLPFIVSDITPKVRINGFTTASRAYTLEDGPYIVGGNEYEDGVELSSYYHIHWDRKQAGDVISTFRKISVTGNYFYARGIMDQHIEIITNKNHSDGTRTVQKENVSFARVDYVPKFWEWQ